MAEDTNGAVVVVVRTKAHAHQSFIRQHIQALSKLCVRCVMFAHKIPAEETRKQIGLLNAWVGSQKIVGQNPRRFPWVSVERLFWGYFLLGLGLKSQIRAKYDQIKGSKRTENRGHFVGFQSNESSTHAFSRPTRPEENLVHNNKRQWHTECRVSECMHFASQLRSFFIPLLPTDSRLPLRDRIIQLLLGTSRPGPTI